MNPSRWKSSSLVRVAVCIPGLGGGAFVLTRAVDSRHSKLPHRSAAIFPSTGAYSQHLHGAWKTNTGCYDWMIWAKLLFNHSPSASSLFSRIRSGRVGKQSRQGSDSTNNQGSVQRSAILQILNCLYNLHLSPHGCFNPSNGFFMDAPTFLELKTKPQNNSNETAIARVRTGFQ